MSLEIIAKKFNSKEIFFETINGKIYLNATKTAQQFSKHAKHWLANKETSSYINSLKNSFTDIQNSDFGDFVVVRKGGNDKNSQGTWIHQKLIIAFARWLSPDFAVWCDFQIEDILKSQSSQSSQPKENIDLDEILAISKKMLELASMFGLSRESRYLSADSGVEKITGNSPLKLLGISQRVSIKEMPII